MFIGYYKSVNSSKEFYSIKREDLNFPMQVEYKGDRYLKETASKLGIECDVEIDLNTIS